MENSTLLSTQLLEQLIAQNKKLVDQITQLKCQLDLLTNLRIISGSSCQKIAESICLSLNKQLTPVKIERFANGEINVEINETIRGTDVFVIQTGANYETLSINDLLMELMLLLDTCKRSHAKSISVIMPMLPYARSDKKDNSRVPIGASLIINMLKLCADRIITIDLHSGQIQGFTSGPSDNLYAINLFCDYLKKNIFEGIDDINEQFILVSPDAGAEKRTRAYDSKLGLTSTILTKQRDYSQMNCVSRSILTGNTENVRGKTAIIPDDIIDTAGTMVKGVEELKKYGIKDAIIIATHGILSGPAIDRINSCNDIIKVIVTNSIDQTENQKRCSKLEVIDLSGLLSECIRRIQMGESLSVLFE